MNWDGDERRAPIHLDEELIERIAEKAAGKVIERMYQEVGKSVVKKIIWIATAAGLATLAWLAGNGHLK